MRVCLLNSVTKEVINIVSLNSIGEHNPTPGVEVAPQHDGDIGWIWNGSGWTDPSNPGLTEEQLTNQIRRKRDKALKRVVDKMNAVRWETLTQQQKDNYINYRQALLDIPQQPGFPYTVTWPTPPQI